MLSEIQQKFMDRWEVKKSEGLVDWKPYWGNLEGATVDSVLAEDMAIDDAIAKGHYMPLPDTF